MKKILLQWVLPFGITFGMLWWAFSLIENPREIPKNIALVPWHVHVLFVLITLFSMWCRAIRWVHLLPGQKLTAAQCFSPLMIGFMLNALFPARAGEFGRSVVLSQRRKVPFSSVLGSVLLERIFDGVILLASLVVVLSLLGATMPNEAVTFGKWTITPEQMNSGVKGLVLMVGVVLAGVLFVLLPITRGLTTKIVSKVLPTKIATLINDQIHHLASGFGSLRSPKAIAIIVFWTLIIWATVALSGMVGAWGFEELRSMSFLQAWAVTVIICIAILIPASPGYWGLYEAGVIVACATLGLTQDKGVAVSYSIVIHFWQIACTVLVGLFFLWREGMSFSQLKRARAEAQTA